MFSSLFFLVSANCTYSLKFIYFVRHTSWNRKIKNKLIYGVIPPPSLFHSLSLLYLMFVLIFAYLDRKVNVCECVFFVDCGKMFGRVNQCFKRDSTSSANIRNSHILMWCAVLCSFSVYLYSTASTYITNDFRWILFNTYASNYFPRFSTSASIHPSLQIITNNTERVAIFYSTLIHFPSSPTLAFASTSETPTLHQFNK